MADQAGDHDEDEVKVPGYKPPEVKTLDAIVGQDNEDESLRKYKEQLLGSNLGKGSAAFPDDPRNVVVTKLALTVEGRPDVELDLTGDLKILKKSPFTLKEGCQYRVKIYFYVQREIVAGLKYVQTSYRKGIRVDKTNYMVGSYGPKQEEQSYRTPVEDAPSGMVQRGTYTVKSLFTDDDKNEYLAWEWQLEIKKDWKE